MPFNISPIDAISDIPGLYISDISIPKSAEKLEEHGISYVLTLLDTSDCEINPETGVVQKRLKLVDDPFADLLAVLEECCDWIDDVLSGSSSAAQEQDIKEKEATQERDDHETRKKKVVVMESTEKEAGKVLVHCLQGMSRSGSIIIAYMMRKFTLTYGEALEMARKSRPFIAPNEGFAEQLELWHRMQYSIYIPETGGEGRDGGVVERKTNSLYRSWRERERGLTDEDKTKAKVKSMAVAAVNLRERLLARKKQLRGMGAGGYLR